MEALDPLRFSNCAIRSHFRSLRAEATRKYEMTLFVGTSGWTYDGWRGRFYPDDVARKDWLGWYAGNFSTAEINSSFYRTPSLEAVRMWRDATPKGFIFSWKASKFITHWKRLPPTARNSL